MADETAVSEVASKTQPRGGKFLTFMLGDEEYGLEILSVREINGAVPITAVPGTPDFVKGVINLRGKVIPIVDLRLKFGMIEAEHTDQTCIIVVDAGDLDTEVGIVVDEVCEVLEVASSDVDDAPSFGVNVSTDFILGMGKTDGRVTILLDITAVLGREGLAAVAAAATD